MTPPRRAAHLARRPAVAMLGSMPRSVTHVARLLPAAMLLALLGAGVGLRMAPPAQAAGTPFYLHGSGPYTFDQTAPSGSTQTFAMTAANATRTWATTTTPSGSQTIHPSSTFSLNYWTTGAGTSASTNLTLGYSASSTCVSGIARVQLGTEAVNSSGLSVSPTLASASTAGNLLVATVYGNSTVTLNGPAGWTRAAAVQGTGVGEVETWYYANNPGGITTATWSSQSGGAPTMAQLSEWSGVATSSPVDATGTANVAATTTPTATAGSATTGGGELAVGGFTGSVYKTPSWRQGSGRTHQMKGPSKPA